MIDVPGVRRGGDKAIMPSDVQLAGPLGECLIRHQQQIHEAISTAVLFERTHITLPIGDAALVSYDLGLTRDLLDRVRGRV